MRKFIAIGVALFAVVAVSAVAVGTATAAPTFLAAEWLFEGEKITTKLAVEATGELLLEDTNALKAGIKADLLCSGILDGTVGPGAEDEIIELLNLEKVAISLTALTGTSLTCTNDGSCESPKVWAVHLPWLTEVELWEEGTASGFAILIFEHETNGKPGWYVECTVLGVKATDECLANTQGVASGANETGGVLTEFLTSLTELLETKLALCSSSGEETGIVEGPGLETAAGGTLSISSVTP